MSLQFAVPTVKDIRGGFKHKALPLEIDYKPSCLSIRQLRLKLRANLRAIPCLLADILGYGWEFLLMTEDDWILAHHTKEGTDPDDETSINAIIPPMPIIENPGYFVIKQLGQLKQPSFENKKNIRSSFNRWYGRPTLNRQ